MTVLRHGRHTLVRSDAFESAPSLWCKVTALTQKRHIGCRFGALPPLLPTVGGALPLTGILLYTGLTVNIIVMDLRGACVDTRCTLCRPAKRKKLVEPTRRPVVAIDTPDVQTAGSRRARPSGLEPLFLLERLPHTRAYCLSVCAASGAHLQHAEAVVQGTSISVRCHISPNGFVGDYNSPSSDACAPLAVPCCMHLDVGEELDCRPAAASFAIADGIAYARIPLAPIAPPVASQEGSAEARAAALSAKVKLPFAIKWGSGAGTGRWQIPVPCTPPERVLVDGAPPSRRLREESGLYHRAASQRRHERAALSDAHIYCRRCCHSGAPTALVRTAGVRALPDVDYSQLSDFMQCCNEIGFDWRCVFPPPQDASTAPESAIEPMDLDGTATCYLGTHSLHLRAAVPSADIAVCCRAESFCEPACYRHLTAASAVGVWAPVRCSQCHTTLGAQRIDQRCREDRGCDDERERVRWQRSDAQVDGEQGAAVHAVPVWFDTTAPPELDCNLQLLKCAICTVPDALSMPAATDAATDMLSDTCDIVCQDLTLPYRAVGGYSIAAILSERILRVIEDEEEDESGSALGSMPYKARTGCFALVTSQAVDSNTLECVITDGSASEDNNTNVEALLWLLSPYVTLATNQQVSLEEALPQSDADLTGATDALKVLYTTDAAVIAAQLGSQACNQAVHLVLPEAGARAEVLTALRASTELVPKEARRVGALCVGFLPVAPTWD